MIYLHAHWYTYIHIDILTCISQNKYYTSGLSAFGDLNKLFNSLRIVVASATRVCTFYYTHYYPYYLYSSFLFPLFISQMLWHIIFLLLLYFVFFSFFLSSCIYLLKCVMTVIQTTSNNLSYFSCFHFDNSSLVYFLSNPTLDHHF